MPRPARSRNFHVPLPADLHVRLHEEAKRSGKPATELARQAIRAMLRARERQAVHEELATYAREAGGSAHDLDPELERAAASYLHEDDEA